MAKVKGVIVACLLILMSFIFVACGEVNIETLSFEKENISISVGERVDLGLTYSPETASLDEIEFSTTDNSVAYVLPGTTTLAGLKAGSVVVYAKAKNGKTASVNVEVVSSRINLAIPQNLKIHRTENELSWIASPGAFNYEIEIQYKDKSITKTTAESYLNLDEIEDLTFTPGEIVSFRIRAMAPMASYMYSNSEWSEWVKYNELNAVQNLKYDLETNLISFAYDPEDQEIDGKDVYFYLTINGKSEQILKNNNGNYSFKFAPQEAGEYSVNVVAMMPGMDMSAAKEIKIVKLAAPTFSQNGGAISANTEVDNAKISLDLSIGGSVETKTETGKVLTLSNIEIEAGQIANLSARIEKVEVEEVVDGIATYYLASDGADMVVEKVATPVGFVGIKDASISNKIAFKWIFEEGVDYSFYQNANLIEVEQQVKTESGKTYVYVVLDNIDNAGEYSYYVSASKENLKDKFYLPSSNSETVAVQKLESLTAKFDQSTKTISYEVASDCVGAYIVLKIVAPGETRSREVYVDATKGEIDISENLIGIEDCELQFYVKKENDDKIYLNSNTLSLVLTKLLPLNCGYVVKNEDTEIEVSILAQENATKYALYLNDVELKTEVLQDGIYATELTESMIGEDKYLTFTIKNINFAGTYKLTIIAEGENKEDSLIYILNSEAEEYEFIKLASPTLSHGKTSNEGVNFTWDTVSGAKYLIVIENLNTHQIVQLERNTTSISYNFTEDDEYLVSVIAIPASTKVNYLKSNKNDANCSVVIKKLSQAQNAEHVVVEDLHENKNSVLEFDAVEGAEGYNVSIEYDGATIKTYDTYQLENEKVKFNLGEIGIYTNAGQYKILITATSGETNVLDSKQTVLTIKKLATPTNVAVNYEESSTTLSFEVAGTHNNFEISIDGGEFESITTNKVDISHLLPGLHQVRIIAVGNDKDLLSSDVLDTSFKVLTRLETPENVEFEVDATDDRKTVLTFDAVENASYYKIVCKNGEGEFEIELRPETILTTYEVIIQRSKFFAGIQQIYVVALPAENSETFIESKISKEIFIRKSADVSSVSNLNGFIDLTGKQANIDGTLHTNITFECDWLLSGETKTIKVRNVSTIVDGYDSGNVFNLAGIWATVELQRLSIPTVEIENNELTFEYVDEGIEYQLILKVDYIGMNSIDGNVSSSFEFNLTEKGMTSAFDIRQFINNNISLPNKVGDYKVYILAKAMENESLKLNFDSEYSSNALNGSDEDYRYTENLSNTNAIFEQSNNGEVSLTISSAYLMKLNKVYLQVEQAGKACRIEINLKTGSVNQLENTLNNVALSPSRENVAGGLKFKVNIHALVNAGAVKVSYNLIGDDVYYISSSVLADNNLNKLATPTFEYQYDENGNKIVLTNIAASAGQNVKFYAKYQGEKKEFVATSESTYFYIPYEWTNLLDILVCAETTETGFINSDNATVNFARASSISNLHLTEDSSSGRTYLEFNTPNNNYNYLVYVYNANGELKEILPTNTNKLLIEDDLISEGNATFKVAVKGYVEGGVTYLNSDQVSLDVRKLENKISITNPAGILTWNSLVNENEIKEFRIKVGSTLYNFAPEIHTFDMKDLSGYMTIYFKVVGDPTQNIISSNYKEFYVYKYESPDSFKVKDGQFNIDENLETIDFVGNRSFVIHFGNSTFLYNDYLNYDASILQQFYELIGAGNTGKVSASIIVAENSKVVHGGREYLAVNSDKTEEVDFGVYEIDVENDEFYLTQTALATGVIETYFNWEWIDETFASKGTVRVIIKSNYSNRKEITDEWQTILDANGQVAAYYLDVTPNNVVSGGTYTGSKICVKLPNNLPAGSYTIQVQKTAIGTDANLSSKNINVVNFVRLSAPNVEVKGGKLVWPAQQFASHYLMRYTNSAKVSFWTDNIVENSFEPHSIYASATIQNPFTYKMLAVGNVGELKPTENLKALEFEYVVASENFEGDFTKLRAPAEIDLINGILRWRNEAEYICYNTETAILEFVFMDLTEKVLTTVKIPAKDLLNSNALVFMDDYLSDGQRNILKSSGKVIVKYRQLGETFENHVNSEYVYLNVFGSQTTVINGIVRSYYEFLNASVRVSISEAEGLSFAAITYDAGLLSEVVYDVYFKIGASSSATIKLVKSQSTTNISFAELKELLRINDPTAEISEIFVVARGNNTYYLSSLKSTIMYVNTINGEASMYIEDGLIKWKNIDGAGSYVIKSAVDGSDPVEYVVRSNAGKTKFYVNDVETSLVQIKEVNGEKIWQFNIAGYNGIADGEHNFYIRYMPTNEGNVFAFPGEWTTTAIRVYKIGTPNVSLQDGMFVWNAVPQAQGYKIVVSYEDGENSKSYSVNQDELKYLLNVEAGTDISKYTITFQSVGTNGSVNGIYYISSAIVVKTDLKMQTNDISNVVIDGDILSWEGSGEKYILYITGQDGEKAINQPPVIVESKSYDLSKLKLRGGENASYQVTIQVAGDSENLASVVSAEIPFKVLPTMDEIGLDHGYIKFKMQDKATSYTITLNVGQNIYRYTIALTDFGYKVQALNQEYIITGERADKDVSSETDIYAEGNYIYFWPSTINMTSSGILSVKANGYKVDDTTYISSYDKEYGAQITRPDISKITISKVEVDQELNTTKISWKLNLNFNFELKYVLLKLDGDEYKEVELSGESLNALQTTLTLKEALESGSYKLELQIIPTDSTFYMKSLVKTLTFSVRN